MALHDVSSPGAILLGEDRKVQMFDWPHKTIATVQAVEMLISQIIVTSRWPTKGQLLHQFWCSSDSSEICSLSTHGLAFCHFLFLN